MFGFLRKKVSIQEIADHTPWCVDFVRIRKNTLEIRGWAVNPSVQQDVTFTVNGKVFDTVEYPLTRKAIGRLFWFVKNSAQSGFKCTTTLSGDEDILEFCFVDNATLKPLNVDQKYYFRRVFDEPVPLPPAANRNRVHGSENESAFRTEGYSTFRKLDDALKSYTDKTFENAAHILDWGCGCCRVSRYFTTMSHGELHGIDIDENNVAWCTQNMPFGEFSSVPLHPPTHLPDSKFDVLFGISVFTHLKENDHFAWLDELARISVDDAILLMTTHGRTTAGRTGMTDKVYRDWHAKGFMDYGANSNLSGAIPDEEYYRNVFHTRKYIDTYWTKHFTIVDVLEGCIGNHQDLVIMRRNRR